MAAGRTASLPMAVLGINHLTAPGHWRDKAFFTESDLPSLERFFKEKENVEEMVVLSTCNRSEIYLMHDGKSSPRESLESLWCACRQLPEENLRRHSYYFESEKSLEHLLRVISSLDSLVVGENQIFGQVKEAFESARERGWVGFHFNYIFQTSFRVGKRIRTETALNEGAVSISYAAVELARKVLGRELMEKTVGLIGSGEMGELAASHFQNAGVTRYLFFNRSLAAAETFASKFGGHGYGLEALDTELHRCDIVVAATAAPQYVLSTKQVEKALRKRGGDPVFLIDIAVPRDIEENAGELSDAFLFGIDDLKKVVGENQAKRLESARQAETIVAEETGKAVDWYLQLDTVSTIVSLRKKFETILNEEVKNHSRDSADKEALQRLGRALLNKFLHYPITGIKELGERGEGLQAKYYAERLFHLRSCKGKSPEKF